MFLPSLIIKVPAIADFLCAACFFIQETVFPCILSANLISLGQKDVLNISGKKIIFGLLVFCINDEIRFKLFTTSFDNKSNCNKETLIFFCIFIYESDDRLARRYSLFILAILSKDIPLGHSTSQAPVFVQLPNPSLSI